MKDLGIRVLEFEPESLDSLNDTTLVDGGTYVVTNLGYGVRYINASFKVFSSDMPDYAMFRMELFNLFVQDDDFYIIDEKDLSIRWHVRSDGKFSLRRSLKSGTFDVSFLCVNPFGISDKSTAELSGGKFWDDDEFFWNGVIDWDSNLNYRFTQNTFDVYNLGTASIQPESQMLDITIKANTPQKMTITNTTTGDVYIYNGSLNNSDTFSIKGTRSFKNNDSVFGDTNGKLISLKPGVNSFVVSDAVISEISFDFKFLFK